MYGIMWAKIYLNIFVHHFYTAYISCIEKKQIIIQMKAQKKYSCIVDIYTGITKVDSISIGSNLTLFESLELAINHSIEYPALNCSYNHEINK